MMTKEQLAAGMGCRLSVAATWKPHLDAAMHRFEINTPLRQAHFLAQVGHESGRLRYVKELASGAAYDTGRLAIRLGNTPEADGDGQRMKGRGLIQVTGTANMRACSLALFNDERLLARPELLEMPEHAAESAGWFWASRGCNELADSDSFRVITRTINGGFNGLEDRMALLKSFKEQLLC